MKKIFIFLFAVLVTTTSAFCEETTSPIKVDNPVVVGNVIMLGVNGSEFLFKDFHFTSKKHITLKYNDSEILAMYDMEKKITKIQLSSGFLIVKTMEELKEFGLYEFISEEMKIVKRF